jgi:ribonuclease-3
VISREGPPHAPEFVIEVDVGGQSGSGRAGSKRVAEQAAAEELMTKLNS